MPQKRKDLQIAGPNLWYLVGLITSDGCLSSDGRHIDITSSDYGFLCGLKESLGLTNKVTIKHGSKHKKAFHIQIGNINFYEFLLSLGLMPNKSLTIKSVDVPTEYFCDFLRGLIDGDGSIRRWQHPSNYREQWSLRICFGSKDFIDWLGNVTGELLKVYGRTHQNANNTWVLKYGKMAAKNIAARCYYKGCFGLDRKIRLAQDCLNSYKGWSRSKTALN